MNSKSIESKFASMGARLKVREEHRTWDRWRRQWVSPPDYAVDIQSDTRGQFFELRVPEALGESLDVTVMQCLPRDRHLLMLVRKAGETPTLDRFLCGHDEREWFVAAVPGGASSVRQAMERLQPKEVHEALIERPVSTGKRFARKNRAFRRQGEWFFIPAPDVEVDERLVLRNEPLRRGGGKPHMVAELCRHGGETVHVCAKFPRGISSRRYERLLRGNPKAASWNWRQMVRNPDVYVRGTVRHRDHATIDLSFWHRVVMNTETQTRTMENVAFLD